MGNGKRNLTGDGGSTVLVVDDEDAVRDLLSLCLSGAGYRVMTARDGREALVLVEEERNRVGLVVTDIQMPNMSGIDLAAYARRARPECAVLLISGEPLPAEGKAGECEFLPKPFKIDVFVRTVERLLNGTGVAPAGNARARAAGSAISAPETAGDDPCAQHPEPPK